ncbi:acyl-CoA dehydrogenase family protein [Brevundimonas lutea]|uniref:acyl-CoA dehydrogenase family protein n=1 Tax=Brevundimonas lutea TaxID=2293980 RepID=UPI000F03178D|nr:acyl-CoA dehydrogenase family protein [Brevundimonas lutea]
MALILTDEQQMLAEAADGLLGEEGVGALRRLRDDRDPDGLSRDLWRTFGEMGLAGVMIDEAHGGSGLGAVEAGVIAEALGKHLTPSPFLGSSVLGAGLIVDLGSAEQKDRWLPGVAEGEAILALALEEGGRHAPHRIAARAERDGNGFRLNGSKAFVLDGHVADALIVAARTSGKVGDREGVSLFLVDPGTAGVAIERTAMVDAHNAARIMLDDVRVDADALLGELDGAGPALDRVLDLGRGCAAASLVGAGAQAFDLTLDYLRTRTQFGRAIGEFQALQHRAAHLFTELEIARAAVLGALQTLDRPGVAPAQAARAVAVAKAKAGQVAELAVQEAVQMHGGVGMTDEFDVGLYMKRVRVLNETLGDVGHHQEALATADGW